MLARVDAFPKNQPRVARILGASGLLCALIALRALSCGLPQERALRDPGIPNWGTRLAEHNELRNPRDLEWLLKRLFRAHRKCRFSSALTERVTHGAGTETPPVKGREMTCLGALELISFDADEIGTIAELIVRPGKEAREPDGRYTILLVYSGDRWLMYPPAAVVERVH